MNLPEKVELIEGCPRDGFQNVHDIIPFDAKVAIIKKLAEDHPMEVDYSAIKLGYVNLGA